MIIFYGTRWSCILTLLSALLQVFEQERISWC